MDAADIAQHETEVLEALLKKPPYELPKGTRGWCVDCGLYHPRLVGGVCVECREIKEKLK